MAGFDLSSWAALFTTGGTPRDIVQKISAEAVRMLAAPDVEKMLVSWGVESAAMGVDAFVVRHRTAGVPWQIAQWTDASIINAGDGWHAHPTQALLDLAVLIRHIAASDGSLAGRRIAILGDLLHSRVVRSNLHTLTAAGADVRLAGPAPLVAGFHDYVASRTLTRGSIRIVATADEALEDFDELEGAPAAASEDEDAPVGAVEDIDREIEGTKAARVARS